jgi:lysophospholipase L1-like esterase
VLLRVPEPYSIATALAKLCETSEIAFVDITPYLEAATTAGELSYIPSDTHLSAYGHQIVSRALVERLKALNVP